MRISVVIPCHGGAADTLGCLASLRAQQVPDGVDLEVLVVDNASPDDTASRCADQPGVRVVPLAENRGFAGGVNAGLHAATGSYLMVVNNDTLAAPHLVARLLAPVRRDPRIGISAPVSNHVKGQARIEFGELGIDPVQRAELEATLHAYHPGQLQDLESLSGLCLMMARETWQRIGDFDEAFGHGNFEDDDFCLRARLLGLRLVVVRDAFLHHHGNRTFDYLGLDYQATLAAKQQVFARKWRQDPVGRCWQASLDGDQEAAAIHAAAAMRRYPCWPDGDLHIARHHHAAGRPHASLPHLHRFLQCCPRSTDARIMQAVDTRRGGDRLGGQRLLAQALQDCYLSETCTVDLLRVQGHDSLQEGDAAAALPPLREALELAPEDLNLHHLLGAAQLTLGEAAAAIPHLRQAAAAGDPDIHAQLCLALFESGVSGSAIEELLNCLSIHPEHPGARRLADQAVAGLESRGIDSAPLREALAQLSPCGAPPGA